MTDLAKLVVRMEAQTAQMQSELEKANRKLDRFAAQADKAGKLVAGALAAGAAAGAAALGVMVAKVIEAGGRLDDLSVRLGVSVENLSRLEYAAERTGVKSETLATALQTMARNIAQVADTGKGKALPALNALGLSAEKLSKLTADQQFIAIAGAMEQVTNSGDKVRNAMLLMGGAGAELLQTMENGAAGVAALAAESDALGNTMSTKTAKAAAEADDALLKVKKAVEGTAKEMFSNLSPQIIHLAKGLEELIPEAGRLAVKSFNYLQGAMLYLAGDFRRFVGEVQGEFGELIGTLADGYYFLTSFSPIGRMIMSEDEMRALADSFKRASQETARSSNLLFDMAEERFKAGSERLKKAAAQAAPALTPIAMGSVQGSNPAAGVQAAADKAAKLAEKSAAREEAAMIQASAAVDQENARIISLTQERFRRLHEEALAADAKTVELENLRYAREQTELATALQRMQERGILTQQIQDQFRQAELDAEKAHQGQLLKIEQEAADARNAIRMAQLDAVGNFFGALGAAMKEGSKAQRALFAAEKAAALAQSLIALQTAIAKANALGFPANIPAIAQAVSVGASAISAIKGVQFGGARAEGGEVSRGKAYLVGERGPELFMPGNSGNITPNHALGGVNVTIIENPQKAGTVERDQDAVRVFVARVKSELAADIGSGRGIAQTFQQTYGLRRVGTV